MILIFLIIAFCVLVGMASGSWLAGAIVGVGSVLLLCLIAAAGTAAGVNSIRKMK